MSIASDIADELGLTSWEGAADDILALLKIVAMFYPPTGIALTALNMAEQYGPEAIKAAATFAPVFKAAIGSDSVTDAHRAAAATILAGQVPSADAFPLDWVGAV